MTGILAEVLDDEIAHLVADLGQRLQWEFFQICRRVDVWKVSVFHLLQINRAKVQKIFEIRKFFHFFLHKPNFFRIFAANLLVRATNYVQKDMIRRRFTIAMLWLCLLLQTSALVYAQAPCVGTITVGVEQPDSLYGTIIVRTDMDEFTLEGLDTTLTLPCGDRIEVEAVPVADFHFAGWSDGSRVARRRVTAGEEPIEVRASFDPDCYEYANWPVVALYDWLLMVNVNEINALGYFPKEDHVVWYKVVDTPDNMQGERFPKDDRVVGTGFYLTIDRNMRNTSDYYYVVDVSSAIGMLCDTKMRSEVVSYTRKASHVSALRLAPSVVSAGEEMVLDGVDAAADTRVVVYDAAGRVMMDQSVSGDERYSIPTAMQPGCYVMRVENESQSQVFRFIISK